MLASTKNYFPNIYNLEGNIIDLSCDMIYMENKDQNPLIFLQVNQT